MSFLEEDLIEKVIMADSRTKGYKFHCADVPNRCADCSQKLVSFVTQNVEEAYQHSKINSVAMWISKD